MASTLDQPVRVTRRLQVIGFAATVLVVVLGVLTWRSTLPNTDPGTDWGTGWGTGQRTGAVSAADVTVLVHTEDFDGVVDASARSGHLDVLDGGCLGLSDGALLVFPKGSTVSTREGQVAVEVPQSDGSRATVRPGDDVTIGPASDPMPLSSLGEDLAAQVPASCRGYAAYSAFGGVLAG